MTQRESHQYSGVVIHGDKIGRTLGFPSANIDPAILPPSTPRGVYSADVTIANKQYTGVLYFGPRYSESGSSDVLEIHVLDFSSNLYDTSITFQLNTFIRQSLPLASKEAVIRQITADVTAVRQLH